MTEGPPMSVHLPTATRTPGPERLGPLDASFLHLERDFQHLHVGSVLLFEGPAPSYDDLCSFLDDKLSLVPRYRQRVRHVPLDLGRPVWCDDPDFDVHRHVRQTTVPAPGDEPALRSLAAEHMSRPLDLTVPLWELWLVTGLADGRWATLNKVHHAMIDGVSGTDIMSVLLDDGAHAPPRQGTSQPWQPRPEPSRTELLTGSFSQVVGRPADLARLAAQAVRSPRKTLRQGATQVSGLTRLGAKFARPESVLDGPLGPGRRWEWVRADLGDVKAVKNACDATVNDVVLAAVAGGLRTFLLSRDEPVEERTVRTMVPVSTRAPGDGSPGNQVSAVFADLPVGVADPLERLAAVSHQLRDLKRSGMAEGMGGLLAASGFLPPTLFALGARAATRLPQRSVSTVTTNVPGPQRPLHLLGRRMLEMFPYIPLASQVRVTIGIASYDGKLTFGVTGDRVAVPDLAVLAAGIDAALTELLAAVAVAD
jgi:diacylglycerol O-acyltransferase